MKQRTRLIIAFLIVAILPMILTGGAFIGFRNFQMRQLAEDYGIETDNYSFLLNTVQLMNQYTKDEYEELKSISESKPGLLMDESYLRQMNERLEKKQSELIVYISGEPIYASEGALDIMPKDIPESGVVVGKDGSYGTYIDSELQMLIKQVDFTTANHIYNGRAYILTNITGDSPEVREMIIDLIVSVVIILLVTALLLSVWIYRGMVDPIRKLQLATKNIMEDNLDFTIEVKGDDEVSDLCQSFEDMRVKLLDYSKERLESEQQNRELISNISHDLKTPLTAIKGYLEGIMDGVADTPEKQERYLRTIYNKTNDMAHLVNELTLYSQINTNRIPYNFAKLNVVDFFGDCREALESELGGKDIRFDFFNYVSSDVLIIADPEQLKRTIDNIVSNSIKYMDKPDKYLAIRIKDVGDFIQVEIEDNGKGIDVKDLSRIFERFYRTDSSRNSATGGSGIGLSIVKKIIEDHGGKIWATSQVGAGTTMYFVIRKHIEQ